MLLRQKNELQELEEKIAVIIKQAKKKNRAEIETQVLKLRYELKAKHLEEQAALEESGGLNLNEEEEKLSKTTTLINIDDACSNVHSVAQKKEKAKRKQVSCCCLPHY